MDEEEFSPSEASKRLGISTSKLRRYVSNFTHLFSGPARRDRDRRYTSADLDVLQRIQQLGERIAFLPSSVSAGEFGHGSEAGPLANEGPATLETLAEQLRALHDQVLALAGLSQIEWAVLTQRQERLQQRIDLIGKRLQAKADAGGEYIRTASDSTWHWMTTCPRYPRGGRFITRRQPPPNGRLCTVCKRLDEAT